MARRYHLISRRDHRKTRCGRVLVKGPGVGYLVLNLGTLQPRCKSCWKKSDLRGGE